MTSVTAEVMNNLRIDKEVNDILRMQLAFLRHKISLTPYIMTRGLFMKKLALATAAVLALLSVAANAQVGKGKAPPPPL